MSRIHGGIEKGEARALLTQLFDAAIAAANPEEVLARYMPAKPEGRTVVIGAGKGAAHMAAIFEKLWHEKGNGSLQGVVVTRYGYGVSCRDIEVIEASHPLPDEMSEVAARRLMEAVLGLDADDLVIALISGGGSALLAAPPKGLSLADEVILNEVLLKSGAPISAMNAIRKHVSNIKGGRLAAMAHPAKVVSLIISDIPGDNPALVASGPTVPDFVTRENALALIELYHLDFPPHILAHIRSSAAAAPSPDMAEFARDEVHIIASSAHSLEAAAQTARAFGIHAAILSDAIEGEAREIAHMHAAIAREIATRNQPFQKPMILLSGGETTVTMRGQEGRGGRNSEFLLALALDLDGIGGITALAADTDGIDGSQDNAGAFFDEGTLKRMRERKCDPRALLNAHDSWGAFSAAGDLFVTGPTGTNVNDFRAILIV